MTTSQHLAQLGSDLHCHLVLASDSSSNVPTWLPAAAFVAAIASVGGLLLSRTFDRRDRRRVLYSEAYQAALAWEEVYYRVRRRDVERSYDLAAHSHELQERVNFHEGWISSESPALGNAYCRLVLTIKSVTAEPIREAWSQDPVRPADGFSVEALRAPEISAAKERFTEDLRDHLSLNPLRRLAVDRRYRDDQWKQIKREIFETKE